MQKWIVNKKKKNLGTNVINNKVHTTIYLKMLLTPRVFFEQPLETTKIKMNEQRSCNLMEKYKSYLEMKQTSEQVTTKQTVNETWKLYKYQLLHSHLLLGLEYEVFINGCLFPFIYLFNQ